MKTKEYNQFLGLKHLTLNDLYESNTSTLAALKSNIINVIESEAPLTLNTLKARMRECFDVAKISQKALDIILDIMRDYGAYTEYEIYDMVIWPKSGKFNVDYLRINSNRLIYDIPSAEFKNLVYELNLKGEELYRAILKYFGLEVLTKKANDYLAYIEKVSK